MTGFIHGGNTQIAFYIYVVGYPEIGYLDYTLREAIKNYRQRFGLVGKHINFIKY